MGSRVHFQAGVALLLIATSLLFVAALLPAACEGDCEPTCGDCSDCTCCIPFARMTAAPAVAPATSRATLLKAAPPEPSTAEVRAIEHVPLVTAA